MLVSLGIIHSREVRVRGDMLDNFREGSKGKGMVLTKQIYSPHRIDETRLRGLHREGVYNLRGRVYPNPAQPFDATLPQPLEDCFANEILELPAPNVVILKIHAGRLNGVKMTAVELPFVVPEE